MGRSYPPDRSMRRVIGIESSPYRLPKSQKFRRTTLPLQAGNLTEVPEASSSVKSAATLRSFSSVASARTGCVVDRLFHSAMEQSTQR
jgi:hypothetical protein